MHQSVAPPNTQIALETFTNFWLCKAFDVIGHGSYKPYVIKCKENHDEWAIKAHQACQKVAHNIKIINAHLQRIHTLPNMQLSVLCKDVISNTTPPCATEKQWAVCHISGEHTSECVQLLRSGGRHSETITIHKKIFDFLKQLWFVMKLEHIIRSIVRMWLERNAKQIQTKSIMEQCLLFQDTFKDIPKFHSFFTHAMSTITISLSTYIDHYIHSIPHRLTERAAAQKRYKTSTN